MNGHDKGVRFEELILERPGRRLERGQRGLMKKALLVFVVSLFALSGPESVAGQASGNNQQEKEAVASIRERYAAVNKNLAKYRVVKKELSGFSTEGGELVAYFEGASVVKIAATHMGETGRSLEEFYYRGGELVFVFHRRETYDAPMSGKVSKTAEERFYFAGGRLIRWLDGRGRAVAPGRGEFREAQARYLDGSRLFVEGARSKNATIEAPEPTP